MKFPSFFTGKGIEPLNPEIAKQIPPVNFEEEAKPQFYTASDGLVKAMNVALLMGKPLLLTGEPGTGKTQFASRVAWEFFGGKPLKFETKSTSKGSDLFYLFNMVGYFQAAQSGSTQDAKEFITYHALGKAILHSKSYEENKDRGLLPEKYENYKPTRSVVLIDEIDKAPRDFPNDILNELEQLSFKIPELENKEVDVEPSNTPIVIITSNSEKNLPETFLRRCIFYHLEFPDTEGLKEILKKRMQNNKLNDSLLSEMVLLFQDLRKNPSVRKKPTTSELLLWSRYMQELPKINEIKTLTLEILEMALHILVKNERDLKEAKIVVNKWHTKSKT